MCMDAGEYRAWTQANTSGGYAMRAESPCDDCLAAFALEMRAEHRCYVHDGSAFVLGRPRGYDDREAECLDRAMIASLAAARKKAEIRSIAISVARQYLERGLSGSETAKLMGVARGTVYSYWRAANRSERGAQ